MPSVTALPKRIEVVVIGSGFAGTLTALILRRLGYDVLVIDRHRHPRFAIGESTTPLADFLLARLADRYDLPHVKPLSSWGRWHTAGLTARCGLKRGTSYFHHAPGQRFSAGENHARELLVAASTHDDVSDTHWHRADVDALLADSLASNFIPLFDCTSVCSVEAATGGGRAITVRNEVTQRSALVVCDFIIDGSGRGGVLPRALRIDSDDTPFRTSTQAIFAHFEGVRPWHEIAAECGSTVAEFPFPADNAALHHVLDSGWMWLLRFNRRLTSCGLVNDLNQRKVVSTPADAAVTWRETLRRHPSLARQFHAARITAPGRELLISGRLQRRWSRFCDRDWVLLPATAGFVDPLHSTGIAQSLWGVTQLAEIFESRNQSVSHRAGRLRQYEMSLRDEFRLLDDLISLCYRTRAHPQMFQACTMLYFAAATTCEDEVRRTGLLSSFYQAGNPAFRAILEAVHDRIDALSPLSEISSADGEDFSRAVEREIEPFNIAGLFQSPIPNMYSRTAM